MFNARPSDLQRPLRPIERRRLQRALSCQVEHVDGAHYVVQHHGEPHHVQLDPVFDCDCHDWAVQSGPTIVSLCKHLLAALLVHRDPMVWAAANAEYDTLVAEAHLMDTSASSPSSPGTTPTPSRSTRSRR